MSSKIQNTKTPHPHEHKNREAEQLASPLGAQKLGKEAYKTAQEEAAKKAKGTKSV